MSDSAQIGVFPGLLEPAAIAAEKLIGDNSLRECEITDIPGFWVSRPSVVSSERVIHTFEYKGESFVIFQ